MQENTENKIKQAAVYKTDIEIDIKYEKEMLRINLFRLFWYFPQYFIITIWSIVAYFVGLFYVLHILFTGERHKWSWDFIIRFTRHTVKWLSYIFLMSDKKPKIIED